MNIKGDAMMTAHDILISWAKFDKTALTEEVKESLENFLDACACNGIKNEESHREWRVIAMQRLIIECIHALSHDQLLKAVTSAKKIAEECPGMTGVDNNRKFPHQNN